MMFEDMFIVRDSGICWFSFNESKPGRANYYHDLVTPFFIAINTFTNETYKDRIRYIQLVDGMRIYFKHIKLVGDIPVSIITIFPERVNGKIDTIDRKFLELKWMLDKNVDAFTSNAELPEKIKEHMREKIELIFA